MKKEMYDASIHFGQFSLNEDIRIACKNAQVRITGKDGRQHHDIDEVIGVVTFCENTESDHLIRERLSRKEQDVFYPWMDVYHSIKRIEKVRDTDPDVRDLSATLQKELHCSGSSSAILAAAIVSETSVIYTLYEDVLREDIVDAMQKQYHISISPPPLSPELSYMGRQIQEEDGKVFDLEELYQNAINLYKDREIDLLEKLLDLQTKENRG